MSPIAGRYGPFFLYSFTLVLALGTGLALLLTKRLNREFNLSGWLDGVLISAAAGLLLGRLAFVRLNPAFFGENPQLVWQLWDGGFHLQAVVAGGIIAFWLWARLTDRPFFQYAALLAPGLALMFAAGWAACWFEGCAYGQFAPPSLLTAPLPDEFGVVASRYRTQLLGFLLSLLVMGLALFLQRRARPSVTVLITIGMLALVDAIIWLRRDASDPVIYGIQAAILLDAAVVVGCLMGLVLVAIRSQRFRITALNSDGNGK